MGLLTAPRLTASLGGLVTNTITLPSGGTWPLPGPEQAWCVKPGRYTSIQQFDPISLFWRTIGGSPVSAESIVAFSDGQQYRLANQTGCAVGAIITNHGSGYTSAPTVTANNGGSIWRAIVGGAVNTSVTIAAGGSNYVYPPTVLFSLPPVGGIPATGYCTLSAGAVNAVTVTNQGAGYLLPPTITFQNDPREGLNGLASGSGAAAYTSLTGAQQVTGLICVDHGTGGLTAVPTLSFAGGGGSSAAATAIMCWSITAYAVTSGGAGYSGNVLVTPYDTAFNATASAFTNPNTQAGLVKTRDAKIIAALSTGAITATGQVVLDGGIFTAAPAQMTQYNTPPGTAAALTFTMGGVTDTSTIFPI